jgi:hypothetical protein
MPLIIAGLAGMCVIVLIELGGGLRVTRWDVARRLKSVQSWRRTEAYGSFLFPALLLFWFSVLYFIDSRQFFVDIYSSWTSPPLLLSLAMFIFGIFWARTLVFFFIPRHSSEAQLIISSRTQGLES